MIKEEVEPLATKEEIENYINEIYGEGYEKDHSTEVQNVINVVRVHGRIGYEDQITYYKDKAENGDEILRQTTFAKSEQKGVSPITEPNPMLKSVFIVEGESRNEIECATFYNGKFVTVYDESDKVIQYSDNTLSKMGEVVNTGIELWDSISEVEPVNSEKQQAFIDAIVEYKHRQAKDEINQNTDNIKSTIQKNDNER